jgi:mono/diheme cytochrome c family protein
MSITSSRTRSAPAIVFLVGCVVIMVSFFALPSEGAPTESDNNASGPVKNGDEIFHQRCVVCHNQKPGDLLPFGPPNLYTAIRGGAITPQQAETIIFEGKGNMPPFRNVLSKDDVRCVIAYLKKR